MARTVIALPLMLLLPLLYAGVKIVAGVLILKYGKRYADKVRAEEKP
jgi:uncharacterized membrane protein